MLTNLSSITTKYRRFTKNQVLTEAQLNEIVNYFDDQDRLTRLNLSGVGIVCGFHVSLDSPNNIIQISQGAGVTSDGDLFNLYRPVEGSDEKTIAFDNNQYLYFKVHNNAKAKYKPFFYNGNNQLQIFELLTEEQKVLESDETFGLDTFKLNHGFDLKDAVVLLYLESYEKELDLCISLSCDNQGLEIIGNHKVLLVSKNVASQINSHDTTISQVNYSSLYHQLPDVMANRVVLKPGDFINYPEIKKSFVSGTFRNNVVNRLRSGFHQILTAMNLPILRNSIINNLNAIYNYNENDAPPDFQYRYDLLKDLVDTYNEIKQVLFNLDGDVCCHDITSFPKHLMLGEITKATACYQFRHAFYKSSLLKESNHSTCHDCLTTKPVYQAGTENTVGEFIIDIEKAEIDLCYGKNSGEEKLKSLIKRAVQLLANYNSNYNFIKITPSFEIGNLSKKSIPFYVNLGDHLIQLWDFNKTVLGNQRKNVSYHSNLLNTKSPLKINIDHDFYRIEGHQGRNYKEALAIIQDIRRQNGLGFNVVVLSVNATEAQELIENFTSYYLNKNHGYEHKAGVAPGGTFVMIYIQGEYSYYQYPYGYGYPYEYPDGDSLAGDFEEGNDEDLTILNPVVADFALPYLCCDENFISLSLPQTYLCFDENTNPLPFHINPTGGYVEADVDTDLNGGVTKNEFGEFVFDPNLVSEELIGVPIKFTVNNFGTTCQITIIQKLVFDFGVTGLSSNPDNEVVATFNITGDNLIEGMEYTWDFGDGSEIVTSAQTSIQHTYHTDELDSDTVTVTVAAGEDTCESVIQHDVIFEILEEIVLGIDKNPICSNDSSEHIITVSPEGSDVELSGDGVSFNEEIKEFVFTATDVPDGTVSPITIHIENEPSNLEITLQEPAIAQFSHSIADNKLTLLNNTQNTADSYLWLVDKEEIIRAKKTKVVRSLDLYEGTSIDVTLSAFSEVCKTTKDGPQEIIIREETDCIETINIFLEKSAAEIEQLKKDFDINNLTSQIVDAISSILKNVAGDVENYTNGNNNNQLPELFTDQQFNQLFEAILEASSDDDLTVLRQIAEIYILLFYAILRCQDPEIITQFRAIIVAITKLILELFTNLAKNKFNIDKDGSLKEALAILTEVFKDVGFLTKEIEKQINKLVEGDEF